MSLKEIKEQVFLDLYSESGVDIKFHPDTGTSRTVKALRALTFSDATYGHFESCNAQRLYRVLQSELPEDMHRAIVVVDGEKFEVLKYRPQDDDRVIIELYLG